MLSLLSVFLRKCQLLMQFFSGTYPRVDNRDIDFRTEAPHAYHFPSQIVDPNPLAHFEHENIPSTRKASGLNDESGGLGDVHEIAGHIRMCHRDRAAKINLSGERRHDAAAATKDVSESHSGASRAGIVRLVNVIS